MYHYTYWLEDEAGKAYIGVRSCLGHPNEDEYSSSSNIILESISNGRKFEKTILALWKTRQEALQHEILLHEIFDVAKNPNFYNKAKQTSTKFQCSTLGRKHSPETIKLFQKQKSGKNNPNYGKRGPDSAAYGHRHTDEQKTKMKHFGEKNGMYGKNHSEESKTLMREKIPDRSGKNNPFYGKKHKEKAKRKGTKNHMYGIARDKHPRARTVHTPCGIFTSVLDAADCMKVHAETIRNRIKSKDKKFEEYYYMEKINETV